VSGGLLPALGVVAVLGLWMLGAYNRLVRLRQALAAAFVQVDGLLRQRHQQLAELLEAAAEGLPSAQPALAALEAARQQARIAADQAARRPSSAGRVASLVLAEQVLNTACAPLADLARAAPEADAGERMRNTLAGLSATQHRLTAAREAFNAEVLGYNASVRQFPTNLVATLFGFRPAGPM
jgi:LemA protein